MNEKYTKEYMIFKDKWHTLNYMHDRHIIVVYNLGSQLITCKVQLLTKQKTKWPISIAEINFTGRSSLLKVAIYRLLNNTYRSVVEISKCRHIYYLVSGSHVRIPYVQLMFKAYQRVYFCTKLLVLTPHSPYSLFLYVSQLKIKI